MACSLQSSVFWPPKCHKFAFALKQVPNREACVPRRLYALVWGDSGLNLGRDIYILTSLLFSSTSSCHDSVILSDTYLFPHVLSPSHFIRPTYNTRTEGGTEPLNNLKSICRTLAAFTIINSAFCINGFCTVLSLSSDNFLKQL
jgi:hypothetical protein